MDRMSEADPRSVLFRWKQEHCLANWKFVVAQCPPHVWRTTLQSQHKSPVTILEPANTYYHECSTFFYESLQLCDWFACKL